MCSVAIWPHCVLKRSPQFLVLWRNVSKPWRIEVIQHVRVTPRIMLTYFVVEEMALQLCWPAGLDIDGLYRVSGNLAVIQKLRFKADHGKSDNGLNLVGDCGRGAETDGSAPCCALMGCAPVLLPQRPWTWRTASGRTCTSSPERWSCFSESFPSRFSHTATLMTSSQPSVSILYNPCI